MKENHDNPDDHDDHHHDDHYNDCDNQETTHHPETTRKSPPGHDQESTKLPSPSTGSLMTTPRMLSPRYWQDPGGCGSTAKLLPPSIGECRTAARMLSPKEWRDSRGFRCTGQRVSLKYWRDSGGPSLSFPPYTVATQGRQQSGPSIVVYNDPASRGTQGSAREHQNVTCPVSRLPIRFHGIKGVKFQPSI